MSLTNVATGPTQRRWVTSSSASVLRGVCTRVSSLGTPRWQWRFEQWRRLLFLPVDTATLYSVKASVVHSCKDILDPGQKSFAEPLIASIIWFPLLVRRLVRSARWAAQITKRKLHSSAVYEIIFILAHIGKYYYYYSTRDPCRTSEHRCSFGDALAVCKQNKRHKRDIRRRWRQLPCTFNDNPITSDIYSRLSEYIYYSTGNNACVHGVMTMSTLFAFRYEC